MRVTTSSPILILLSSLLALSACASEDASSAIAASGGGASDVGGAGGDSAGTGGSGAGATDGMGGVPGTGGAAASPGAGGMSGSPGAGGTGASAGGMGGAPGSGGMAGASAAAGNGGSPGAGGMSGAPATGGAAGSGGAGGMAGSPGAGGTGGGSQPLPPCIDDPLEQAAIVGDSYVTGALGSPPLQPALASLHAPIGQYPNYAFPGTAMASGGLLGLIPPQFDTAVANATDLKLLIMDGGGNDILICDAVQFPACNTTCNAAGSSSEQVCTDIVDLALSVAQSEIADLAAAGVKDVVYFFYPHIPSAMGGYTEILDYAEPRVRQLCDDVVTLTGGQTRCHFVSTVAAFAAAGGDMNPANFVADQIHPSDAGQAIIAAEIWKTMQDNCLGMPSSAGCCAP